MNSPTLGRLTASVPFSIAHVILAAAVIALYWQTLHFGFSGLDDSDIIIPRIVQVGGVNVKAAFSTDAFLGTTSTFYRPLQSLTLMVDAAFSKQTAAAYHLSNMMYHLLACAALMHLLIVLRFTRVLSLFFALVYAVHPLFVHAVAWVPARGDLLIGVLAPLSLLCFIDYCQTRSLPALVLHTCFVLLALLSKEAAVVLPLVCVSYYWLIVPKQANDTPRASMYVCGATWATLIGVVLCLRSGVGDAPIVSADVGVGSMLANWRVPLEFLGKFAAPVSLSPMPAFSAFNTGAGLFAAGVGAGVAWVTREKRVNVVLFGVMWFVSFALPSLMYRHSFGTDAYDYLEQRAYLPLMGVVIIACEMVRAWGARMTAVHVLILGACVVCGGVRSFVYSGHYRDERRFLSLAIRTNPRSAVAYYNRGTIRAHAAEYDGAWEDFGRAIELRHEYSEAYNNRGVIAYLRRRYREALGDFDLAIAYKQGSREAWKNRGLAKLQLGDRDGGCEDLETAAGSGLKEAEDEYGANCLVRSR
jgi:protein O-mannosyl-transferase